MIGFLLAVAVSGNRIDEQVRDVTAYCGFLTGMIIACPLEFRIVCFDPRSSLAPIKILRFALSILLLGIVLFGLKAAFRPLATAESIAGCALEYLRYVVAEFATMFVAPYLFCKMNLARKVLGETPNPALVAN
jgi:hypothetical protein